MSALVSPYFLPERDQTVRAVRNSIEGEMEWRPAGKPTRVAVINTFILVASALLAQEVAPAEVADLLRRIADRLSPAGGQA